MDSMHDGSQAVQDKIDSSVSLSAQPTLAIRLAALAKDPEADLAEYASLIRSDQSFSCALLALVNSAWFSPRVPITSVKQAVALLGVKQITVFALHQCLASLHAAWSLDPKDAYALGAAALYSAAAARQFAEQSAPHQAEDAFTWGLLQNLGLAVLTSVDPPETERIHSDPAKSMDEQLSQERQFFGMDHAKAGEKTAIRLGLPPVLVRSIADHHDRPRTDRDQADGSMDSAMYVISHLPHDIRWWSRAHIRALGESLSQMSLEVEQFLSSVEEEFMELHGMLYAETPALPSPLDHLREAQVS